MSRVVLTRRQVLTGSLLALAFVATGCLPAAQADRKDGPRIGLEGYCPVCIIDANKWEEGSPKHPATYDGVTYHFANDATKQKFLANPAKYVPALGGDCTVCYAKLGKRSPGSTSHVVRHEDRSSCSRATKRSRLSSRIPRSSRTLTSP